MNSAATRHGTPTAKEDLTRNPMQIIAGPAALPDTLTISASVPVRRHAGYLKSAETAGQSPAPEAPPLSAEYHTADHCLIYLRQPPPPRRQLALRGTIWSVTIP